MKNVLVDFTHLDEFNGFGEISRNYAPILAKADLPDLHFIFLVPDDSVGRFGDGVDYIRRHHRRSDLRRLGLHVDVWHATDQQFRWRSGDNCTTQLLTIHDLNFLREKRGLHRWRHIVQLRWRIRHSDALTCISDYVRQDILQQYGEMGKTLDVIYNGISDVEQGEQQRPAFVQADDEPFFFTIGQIREKKNFQTLVPMMRHLPGYRLFICGDDHFAFADELRALIAEQGEGRVLLTGKVSDSEKRWLYAHAAAFLFPSRFEGFGIPVLEAMRFGCKVVSSQYSSLPEICSDHATFFTDYTPDRMAATVTEALRDWDRQSPAAQAARQYSLTFNYKRYAEQYIALYRKL